MKKTFGEAKYFGEWFEQLKKISLAKFLGSSNPMSFDEMTSLISTESISVPSDVDLQDLCEKLNWRIRDRRLELMPAAQTDAERDELRLRDYQKLLFEAWGEDSPRMKQTFSALRSLFIPYLKETFGGDPTTGLNHLSDPWSLKLIFFSDKFFSGLQEFYHSNNYDPSYYSKTNSLKRLLINTTANAARTRAKKYNTGSPEIEAVLKEYVQSADVKNTAKTAASEARKVIGLAGVTSLQELLSNEGQRKIVALEYTGQVGQYYMSRPRTCLRWIFEKHGVKYYDYFADLSEEKIFDLTKAPEVNAILDDACTALENGYAEDTLKRMKVLFRLIVRTTKATTRAVFYNQQPSDFIRVALEAEAKGNHLQSFTGIKMFAIAFLEELPKEKQWPEKGTQTYGEFVKALETDPLMHKSSIGQKLRLSDFLPAFLPDGVHWSRFFDVLKKFYYKVAETPNEDLEDGIDVSPEHYQKAQDWIIEKSYGLPCGNKKTGAVRGPDGKWRSGGLLQKKVFVSSEERRSLEVLMAFALQAAGACRFHDEGNNIVFWDHAPNLVSSKGPHKLFWHEEKQCYAILFTESRKNEVAYLCPLNAVADELISKYLKISPKKHGERFFDYNIQKLVDEIKRFNTIIHKPSCSFDEFLEGTRFRGISPHSMRHILRRCIEGKYNGPNKELILTVSLGHKIPRDTDSRSASSGYYGDDLNYSVAEFNQIHRIKNGNYLSAVELELQKTKEELLKSDEKTRRQLREGVEKLNEKADINIALGKANLVTHFRNLSKEEQIETIRNIFGEDPTLLQRMITSR